MSREDVLIELSESAAFIDACGAAIVDNLSKRSLLPEERRVQRLSLVLFAKPLNPVTRDELAARLRRGDDFVDVANDLAESAAYKSQWGNQTWDTFLQTAFKNSHDGAAAPASWIKEWTTGKAINVRTRGRVAETLAEESSEVETNLKPTLDALKSEVQPLEMAFADEVFAMEARAVAPVDGLQNIGEKLSDADKDADKDADHDNVTSGAVHSTTFNIVATAAVLMFNFMLA